MKISKSRISSKCTDGAIVKECTLDLPINEALLNLLQERGSVTRKQLGGNVLFTFTCDLFSLKGMVGDTILYVNHRKEDAEATQEYINSFLEMVPDSDQ
jgi:hypothetical protein